MPLSPIILRCILRDVWISRAGERNWAALDGIGAKFDAVSEQLEGSPDKADQAQAARGKIRTILGSETIQEAALK